MATITHAKTDTIPDWTQAQLNAAIAAGQYPAGTTLTDIVLPSDWNAEHIITDVVDSVNGQTGVVVLDAADVGALDGTLTATRVPFAFDSNTLEDDANFTYDKTTKLLALTGTQLEYSIGDVTACSVTINYSSTGFTPNGYTTQGRVWAYKETPYGRVYSANYFETSSVTDNNAGSPNYTVNFVPTAVSGADGYVVQVRNTQIPLVFADNQGVTQIAPTVVVYPSIITNIVTSPTTMGGQALTLNGSQTVNGNILSSGFIGVNNLNPTGLVDIQATDNKVGLIVRANLGSQNSNLAEFYNASVNPSPELKTYIDTNAQLRATGAVLTSPSFSGEIDFSSCDNITAGTMPFKSEGGFLASSPNGLMGITFDVSDGEEKLKLQVNDTVYATLDNEGRWIDGDFKFAIAGGGDGVTIGTDEDGSGKIILVDSGEEGSNAVINVGEVVTLTSGGASEFDNSIISSSFTADRVVLTNGSKQLITGAGLPVYFIAASGSPNIEAAAVGVTAYAIPNTPSDNGFYRVSFSGYITRAATVSSVLGGANGFRITYTNAIDSVTRTTPANLFSTSTLNTTQAIVSGTFIVHAKQNTNITFDFGYTSVGATTMQYRLDVFVERFN
jgi:hypothetical protein